VLHHRLCHAYTTATRPCRRSALGCSCYDTVEGGGGG
jgi:hypothetical protein